MADGFGLMNLFGGDMSGLNELLTPEQRAAMQRQGAMSMAAQLLAASGPSRTPVGLGQALGQSYLAGQKGYTDAQQQALSGMLTKQKIDEYRQKLASREAMNKALQTAAGGAPVAAAGTMTTAQQALAAPGMPVGPTRQRAAMVGAPARPMSPGMSTLGISQEQAQGILRLPESERAKAYSSMLVDNMSKRQRKLTDTEVADLGLPPGTVATVDSFGAYNILNKPNVQVVQTPAGGSAVIDLDAIARGEIPTTPAAQRAAAAPAVPQAQGTTARASVTQGVTPLFDPALKPEQIVTEARDWSKNYYQPVQNIVQNYNKILELINSGAGGGIDDYGILITAIKALDPTSAVMQGEADSARNMMSLADRMSAIVKQVESGGLGSDVAREQLANLARASVKTAVNVYNSQLSRQRNIYTSGRMPQGAISAILSPIQLPPGAESVAAMREQIRPPAPTYPPNVMAAMERGEEVASDNDGNFIRVNPSTNKWEPIQ